MEASLYMLKYMIIDMLLPLGKVRIQLFSLRLWANNGADLVLQPLSENQCRR